jgi:hypothetical protein
MPSVSAYEFVNGKIDYNKFLLAPLGCAVEMHESTNRQKTWDPHSLSGWYLGTSTEHYRCHKIFCKKTHSERISDTVFSWHWQITQPTVTPKDQIIKAIGDLSSALPHRVDICGKEEMAVLQKMSDILNRTQICSKFGRVLSPRILTPTRVTTSSYLMVASIFDENN